jgi:hypothetical protein
MPTMFSRQMQACAAILVLVGLLGCGDTGTTHQTANIDLSTLKLKLPPMAWQTTFNGGIWRVQSWQGGFEIKLLDESKQINMDAFAEKMKEKDYLEPVAKLTAFGSVRHDSSW